MSLDMASDYHKIVFGTQANDSDFDWVDVIVKAHGQYSVDSSVERFQSIAASAHNAAKSGDAAAARSYVMQLLEAQNSIDSIGGASVHSNTDDPSRFITVARPDLQVYPTGIPHLDNVVSITPKSVTTIIGGTGVGKSMTMTWILKILAERGFKPFMFSVEMPFDEVESRLCSMLTGVYGQKVITKTADRSDIEHISAIMPAWNKKNEYSVDDTQQIDFSVLVSRICTEAAKGRRVFIVDYLDIVNYDGKDGGGKKKWETVAIMVKKLKLLAFTLDLAIITAAQFNREGLRQSAKGSTPTLADIAGTSELLFTSSNVILISKQGDGEEGTTLVIDVAKSRSSTISTAKRRFEVARSPHGVFHSIGDSDFDITGGKYEHEAQHQNTANPNGAEENGLYDYDSTPF